MLFDCLFLVPLDTLGFRLFRAISPLTTELYDIILAYCNSISNALLINRDNLRKEPLVALSQFDNVRELENVVERELMLTRKGPLNFEGVLVKQHDRDLTESPIQGEYFPKLDEIMSHHIHRALKLTNGRIHGPEGAAQLLGINLSTLRSRMKKLGIEYGRSRRY